MITDFRLQVFKAVAERRSFTKAAGELLISQPAVTKHISELERQLRVPLFDRSGGGVALTRHGQLLLDFASRILGLYGNLNDAFADEERLPVGRLKLGASTTIAQYILPGILAAFKRRYPDVMAEMFTDNTEGIERLVSSGGIELGMIEGKASGHALHYDTFMRDELVLVTSVSNSSFRKDEIEAAQLRSLPLVIRESGSGTLDVLAAGLSRCGMDIKTMNIEIQLGSTEAIKRYLLNSSAFAFISVQAVLDEILLNKLRVVEVDGLEITRNFSFVSAHGNHGRLAEMFKQFCMAYHNFKL